MLTHLHHHILSNIIFDGHPMSIEFATYLIWTRLKCLTHSLIFPINASLSWIVFSYTLWIFDLGYFKCWIGIGLLSYPFGTCIWFFWNFVHHGNMGIEAKIWKFILGGINIYKAYNFHIMVWLSWYWNVWCQRGT